MTALLLCAVLCAFYLRAGTERRVSGIPVSRVFAVASPTETPPGGAAYRAQREAQRAEEMQALSALAQREQGAAEALQALIERAEKELAVESALAARGQEAICALRGESALVCVKQALSAAQAQAAIELCAALCGLSAENVFILDECGYL